MIEGVLDHFDGGDHRKGSQPQLGSEIELIEVNGDMG